MAQQTKVILIDDLNGQEADESIKFAFDGASYEIDLTKENAEQFRAAVADYIKASRRVGGRAQTRTRNRGGKAPDVRAWALQNGHSVPSRGRIPAAVQQAYDAAH